MALVSCMECKRQISDRATACPGCGAPQQSVAPSSPAGRPPITGPGGLQIDMQASPLDIGSQPRPARQLPASSRSLYIILALLFGPFGFHDFYVGKYGLGVFKLIVLALTLLVQPIFFAALFIILYLLAIIQGFTVRYDSKGIPLA